MSRGSGPGDLPGLGHPSCAPVAHVRSATQEIDSPRSMFGLVRFNFIYLLFILFLFYLPPPAGFGESPGQEGALLRLSTLDCRENWPPAVSSRWGQNSPILSLIYFTRNLYASGFYSSKTRGIFINFREK